MSGTDHVVLHIPHASTVIPDDVRSVFLPPAAELAHLVLQMTDHFTDELFDLGGDETRIVYPVSRLVTDPERFEYEELERAAEVGMGVIYTRTLDGKPLRRAPSDAERRALLDRFYRPHHARLTKAVDRALAARGRCLVIDCHSYPSRTVPFEEPGGGERPDIDIGTDPDHTPPALLEAAVDAFRREGWSVALNRPFAGALVPATHHRTDSRVEALMIEVGRWLYMDEETGGRLAEFEAVRARLRRALRRCVDPRFR